MVVDSRVLLDHSQLYCIHPLGDMDLNVKLICKMELLLPKLVEGLATTTKVNIGDEGGR